MGMFDDIRYEAPCPFCGTPLTTWQSKDGGCGLQKLTPYELWEQKHSGAEIRFYENCGRCGIWVEVLVRGGLVDWSQADYEQGAITRRMPQHRRGPIPSPIVAGFTDQPKR